MDIRFNSGDSIQQLAAGMRQRQNLARNSHQPTAAGAHLPHFAKAMWGRPESTALGSDKGLDVLYSTPARFVSLAPLDCLRPELRPRGALVEA